MKLTEAQKCAAETTRNLRGVGPERTDHEIAYWPGIHVITSIVQCYLDAARKDEREKAELRAWETLKAEYEKAVDEDADGWAAFDIIDTHIAALRGDGNRDSKGGDNG